MLAIIINPVTGKEFIFALIDKFELDTEIFWLGKETTYPTQSEISSSMHQYNSKTNNRRKFDHGHKFVT